MSLAPRRVSHSARSLLALIRVHVLHLTQYRVNIAIWTIANMLQVVVYLSVWQAVAEARGGTVGGYTTSQFAGYFLVLMIVHELTFTFIPQEFAGYVRAGQLGPLLLRPIHPVFTTMASNFAFRMQTIITLGLAAAVLSVAFDARVASTPSTVIAGLAIIPLATATRVLADSIVGFSAMWLVRIDGIRNLYFTIILLLSGQFAPLDVLPDAMQSIARSMPFYWTLGYPTEVITGRAPTSDVWTGALILAAWCLGLGLIFVPLWRRGTRALEVVGT